MTSASTPSMARAATGRNFASLVARAWRLHVRGSELVPIDGPVLLVANHTGFLDGLVLAAATPRPVHLLADAELFAPPLERLLRGTGQIAWDHRVPDRAALLTAVEVLGRGGIVGLFPEVHPGSGEVRTTDPGAAYLAARTGAAVVPVAVLGSRSPGAGKDALPRWRARIEVVFGAPSWPATGDDARRRTMLARTGERMRQVLADHVRDACSMTGLDLPGPLPAAAHPHHRSDS